MAYPPYTFRFKLSAILAGNSASVYPQHRFPIGFLLFFGEDTLMFRNHLVNRAFRDV